MIQKFIKIYGYLVLRESNLFGRYQEKDLDRAYEINKEMFQAAMDGLIGDVDKSIVMGKIIKFLVTMFQLLSSCIG